MEYPPPSRTYDLCSFYLEGSEVPPTVVFDVGEPAQYRLQHIDINFGAGGKSFGVEKRQEWIKRHLGHAGLLRLSEDFPWNMMASLLFI